MPDFERIVPGTPEWTLYYGNHIARYRWATDGVRAAPEGPVLDAACGVGYGSHHLATETGRHVVGVDRDSTALAEATRHFHHRNVTFRLDDCHRLEVAAQHAPFGAVVSFETLEHLPDAPAFAAAVRKCLAPRAPFIVSTPNGTVTSPSGVTTWTYHVHEFTAPELVDLLSHAGFRDISLFGQRVTPLGALRSEMRGELQRIYSTPAMRVSMMLQRWLRRRTFPVPLPEQPDDSTITPLQGADAVVQEGASGPMVLLAVAIP